MSCDHLIIINRYASFTDIGERFKGINGKFLILSSYHLFESEKQELIETIGKTSIDLIEFDKWNEELEHEGVDEKAFNKSRSLVNYLPLYHAALKSNIIYFKNEFIHRKLEEEGHVDANTQIHCYCDSYELHNLGLSYRYWKGIKAKIYSTHAFSPTFLKWKEFTNLRSVKLLTYFIKSLFLSFKPTRVTSVKDSDLYYLLDTHRVKIKKSLHTKVRYIIPFFAQFTSGYLSAPVHSKSKLYTLYPFIRRKKMVLISDAFRPSTYPHYFAEGYYGSKIIIKNRLGKKYFKRANLETYPLGELIEIKPLATEITSEKILPKVCLSLNHAVDFCSVISRCDTDKLIAACILIAKKNPTIDFTIRLHPTSDSGQGEGFGWSARIKELINFQGLSNLEISKNSLEEDWRNSDIFVSEYSLSVIDALALGKLAVFVNLSKRRSFAADLVSAGFPEAQSIEELEKIILNILNDPKPFASMTAEAAKSFNSQYF